MMGKLWGHFLRQKRNVEIFRAYGWWDLVKQSMTLPKDLYFGQGSASAPLNVALFITLRCNLRCKMCNLLEMLQEGKSLKEPTVEEVDKLCLELKEMGCPGLILFGGEPFVRQDFGLLVNIVKKHGLSCGSFTNGTLLDENRIEEADGLDYLVYSLLGPREIHSDITQNAKAYDKLIKSAKLVRERKKTNVIFHCTITKENVQRLTEVVELGKEIGVQLVRFGHPTFYTNKEWKRAQEHLETAFSDQNASCTSARYEISSEESILYLQSIKELGAKYGSLVAFSPELSEEELTRWYNPQFSTDRECFFAFRGSFIKPNGDVLPCESIDYPMGNAFAEGFTSVWRGPRYKNFRKKLRQGLFPACARCCKL